MKLTLHKKAELFDLIDKDPGELGFILQAETYDKYIETFTEIGLKTTDAPYSIEEFNKLKSYFGNQ